MSTRCLIQPNLAPAVIAAMRLLDLVSPPWHHDGPEEGSAVQRKKVEQEILEMSQEEYEAYEDRCTQVLERRRQQAARVSTAAVEDRIEV